jgi:hypothetical protein
MLKAVGEWSASRSGRFTSWDNPTIHNEYESSLAAEAT